MTLADLISALVAGGYLRCVFRIDDQTFDPIPRRFVAEAHQDWVRSLPPELRDSRHVGGGKYILVPKWLPEVYDCDNHARSFANFVDEALARDAVLHNRTRGNPAGGKFNFTEDRGGKHARNWFVERTPTGFAPYSFDPGSGDFTTESATEQPTIFDGESI